MLEKEATDQSTLELLTQLQGKDYLEGFYLAGGTGLALIFGYRKSADIDLFSNFNFDSESILESLSADFPFRLYFTAINTIKGSIAEVKVDILAHRYTLIRDPRTIDGIRILSVEDIASMKLNAISVSGQRVKDFIDIYYLLDQYSVEEMLGFYKEKYTRYNEVNVLKSLIWFDDIDLADWPILLKDPDLKWDKIKKRLLEATKRYLKQI